MRHIVITLVFISFAVGCGGGATVIHTRPANEVTITVQNSNEVSSYNQVEQAKRLFYAGKYNQATRHLIRAITNNNKNWRAYYYMGLVQQKQERYDRSIGSFQNALKYAPDKIDCNVKITYAMAVSWEKEGYLKRAGDLYKRTLTLNPSHAPAKAGIARVRLKAEKAKEKEINPRAF